MSQKIASSIFSLVVVLFAGSALAPLSLAVPDEGIFPIRFFRNVVLSDDDEYEIVWETRYEIRQVERTVIVTPPEYLSDIDADGLVDAVDPHPARTERDYFTDSDRDAVVDAFDLHPGEDDFAYFEAGEDSDSDGIIDAYERIPIG